MKKHVIAPAVLALSALTLQPVGIAAANSPVTISERFATYQSVTAEQGVVAQARATMPKGFPGADLKAFGDTSASQIFNIETAFSVGISPMKTFLTEGRDAVDNNQNSIRLTGKDTQNNAYREVITFDSPIPAGHLAIDLADIDVERITVSLKDGNGNTVSSEAAFGLQGTYDARTGNALANAGDGPTVVYDQAQNEFVITGPNKNTDDIHSWFIPTTEVTEIVIESSRLSAGWGYVLVWLGAIRPEPTITPTPQVPTAFTLGDDPLAITADMFDSAFLDGILVDDFTDSPDLQFRVVDDGGTGCTLEANSPLSFTATSAGTCTIECFIAETADYKPATFQFEVAVTAPGSPSSQTTPRTSTPAHHTPAEELLAATGAPAWPLWAGGLAVVGVAALAVNHLSRREANTTP